MKLLTSTRLVQIERKFRGYGYQVRAYHPWQIDSWVVDEFKNTTSNKRASNNNANKEPKSPFSGDRSSSTYEHDCKKTSKNRKQTSKKSTCDPHSSEADLRENSREKSKGNTKAESKVGDRTKVNGDRVNTGDRRKVPKPILKETAFAAAPQTTSTGKKENDEGTQENGSYSQGKCDEHTNSCQAQSKGLEDDLNSNLDNVSELDGTDKSSGAVDSKVNKTEQNKDTKVSNQSKRTKPKPNFEVKINNKEWRKHLDELDQLGVTGNKTIVNAVKTFSKEKVENALALYRQRKRVDGHIQNPCGYFMQSLKEDWGSKNKLQDLEVLDENVDPIDKETIFRRWFELAKTLGNCQLSEIREDGERWVLISGTWEKFTDAWERGYTLEYFRKIMKRNKDRNPKNS